MDQSKKTMRHFYCRDVLWETFEQMANDFDCSIDYLINEAMRYYARSKNYQSAQATGGDFRRGEEPARPPRSEGPARDGRDSGRETRDAREVRDPRDSFASPPAAEKGGGGGPHVRRNNPPPPPRQGSPSPGQTLSPPTSGFGGAGGAAARRPGPPSPRPQSEAYSAAANGPTLFLMFNNQRMPIDKDQFIIGRGSKTSDLAIKDGNISRKHAAVIRRNGTYYIKDLGSTNGIDYKGMRIDNKRIDEGDIFHICDYELRFTYR